MGRLDGKYALITGGANGMGAEMARLFVAEGATVLIGDVEEDACKAMLAELGDKATSIKLDVSSEEDWQAVAERIDTTWGAINILVNNAGLFAALPLDGTSLADYHRIINVNQVGCFLGMREIAPRIVQSGGGAIVNMSSGAGLRGGQSMFAYAAAKWAVRGMTKCAALELGPDKVRVNSIHPGPVATRMILGNPAEVNEAFVATMPLRRMGQPIEVAQLALFLVCDESSYITGAEIAIDGGLSI